MSLSPAFQGEVMLAGWSETHNGGAKVTFLLQDESDLAAFKAMTVAKGKTAGQRLAIVAVEIGDDEKPKTANPTLPQDQQLKGGERARLAGMLCQSEPFQEFMGVNSPEAARAEILKLCDISSRRELDHNEGAAEVFEMLRRRYVGTAQ